MIIKEVHIVSKLVSFFIFCLSYNLVVGQSCVNLTPYQPIGWDNKIVLSTLLGTNSSSTVFYDNQPIYLDWAVLNNGSCNIPQTFYTKLYVNGTLHTTWSTSGLNSNYYAYVEDVSIGTLSAGTHSFEIITDANGDVSETNGGDNSYSRSINITVGSCVNLTPYKPVDWDNKIVLSTTTGTNTSASIFFDNQPIYLDWAVLNDGSCNIPQTFYTKLYVDGILHTTWSTSGLNSNYYAYVEDVSIGALSAGTHSFEIITDANGDVSETNGGDNSYSRSINITVGSCVNLTPYKPVDWDNKIVLSTTTGTNTSASTFYDNQPIYLDWAVLNNGSCNIPQTFYTKLYVDGVLNTTWTHSGLNSNYYAYVEDVSIGTLSAGLHSFQIVTDANGDVSETNGNDNSYTRSINIPGNGCPSASLTTAFNGVKNINTDLYQPSSYRLNDGCQTTAIHISDWNSSTSTPNLIEITSPTNSWTTTTQRFGGSVLWATKQSYNYFLNVHSRSSYDGSNGNIEGFVNVVFEDANGDYYTDNAAMSFTGGYMFVGLGSSGTLNNCFGTLDIIGHEFAHAITGSSSQLEYQDESGALNESFSDIFGEAIENYSLGSNDWLLGDDRTSGAIRSMSDPNAYGQPDTYGGTYWCDYTNSGLPCTNYDNGGVHRNSGVQNYWFYLLAIGGSGTNDNGDSYSIIGIGLDKASSIAFRTLTGGYLTTLSDYWDAQMGSIQAAEDLFGIGSIEAIVVEAAWCAVGLGTCMPCNAPTSINVWTGAVNNSWETAGNWSCGVVPTSITNVVINSGTVIVASTGICKTLTVGLNVNFEVNPGANFTVVAN